LRNILSNGTPRSYVLERFLLETEWRRSEAARRLIEEEGEDAACDRRKSAKGEPPLNEDDYSEIFERLSPRKGDCLREAAKGSSSKEIGRALGISPNTVNNHILEIRRQLGNVSKWKAAQLFVSWEARKGGQNIPPQSMVIPDNPNPMPTGPTETQADDQATQGEAEDFFANEQKPYGVRDPRFSLLDIVPYRVAGRQRNELSGPYILIVFAILTTLMLFAVGAGFSLLLALNGLVKK
jgi:DNA-binding CsgD family transcriptional regulator|tara:strand:+ start:2222 stop:2935 length:714 start_codon:yes stop_codon:yes gene_type:complete